MAGKLHVEIRVDRNDCDKAVETIVRDVKRAVETRARETEATAKHRAPVLTGTLRRSIHTVLTNGGMTATVGPSVGYGYFVEIGTRGRSARPYLRPAFEATMPKLIDDVKAILRRAA